MGKELPEYSWKDRIDWPKGFKPLDEPACGYQEEKCQGGKGVTEIVAGVSCHCNALVDTRSRDHDPHL